MPSSRYCSDYPRNLLVPLSFSWFISLAVGPYPWLFLIGLHKSSILHSRGGRVLSFQLSVSLALPYSVKPSQPGILVGPVMKSTAIILIRDRGHGWQWKSTDNLKARSSRFCHALTSQLLEYLEQGLASVFGTKLWGDFWGPEMLSRCPHHRKALPFWLWCGASKGWCL